MIAKLLPVIFALVGSGVGGSVGLFLRSAPAPVEIDNSVEHGEKEDGHEGSTAKKADHANLDGHGEKDEHGEYSQGPEYVKMSNQFVVPVVKDRSVAALMILSLSIEVASGQEEVVFSYEPKLRDSFLQVMFDHANMGGFAGAFTDASTLGGLRKALREVAQRDAGKDNVLDVLILDIARQDY